MLMGHSTLTVTEKWYAHHQPDWLKGATDVLSGTGASQIRMTTAEKMPFESRLPIDLPISGDSGEEDEELSPLESTSAGVAEPVDAGDLKSPSGNRLRVRIPPPAMT